MSFIIEGLTLLGYEGTDKVVTVPEGIVVSGDKAFINNDLLEKVELPEGLEEIGNMAFYNCPNLAG